MDNFKKKFVEEAVDLIDGLEKSLLALEESPDDMTLVQQVFRVMHTLKGNSGMFGFDLIDAFTHEMETIYDLIRNSKLKVTREVLDVTLASVDHLKVLLNEDNYNDPLVQENHAELLRKVASIINADMDVEQVVNSPEEVKVQEADNGESTYYIFFDPIKEIFNNGTNPLFLLDELHSLGETFVYAHLNKVPPIAEIDPELCYTYWEVLLATKADINSISDVFIFVEDDCSLDIQKISETNLLTHKSFINKVKELAKSQRDVGFNTIQNLVKEVSSRSINEISTQKKKEKSATKDASISSIRVSADKLDMLMNLVSELVTTQARLSLFAEENSVPGLMPIAENVQKLSRQLRDTAFSIVLIPIENMLTRFQRLVRDLSSELGKEVAFITEGADTELDKTIIESLADPLMHILRNSLDHGIEEAAERKRKGKPTQGKIILKAFYSGANVMIQISDDGAGINPEIITEKAIAKGIISADRKLSKREVLDLIFLPGFSTARTVTDVSGRGVGMDVVKRKISDIRGEVEVDSDLGAGTTITIKLPLTLSIIDGLLVKVDETHFIIPLSVVDKIFAVEHKKIVSTFNNVVVLDGKQVPFFYIRREFDHPEAEQVYEQVIVVNFEEKSVGLVVDTVIGEYQAVLKPLGKHYKNQDMISGATILGDGTVALVMDTNKIIKLFANHEVFTRQQTTDN
ncbi:MAG TPA: chemotaxis protein CheA [Tenuifilaceae bacterium]|nr:chemotaxis protein CheA [Tenuifilaceae bacterium]HPE17142.1 chemotaxis protein CheA [Tenuifilaceae bacterium]HPJ45870.1 chemotaxis protein CheA [Tenuifilaceae bacterium]HPQ34099.1 chemotaxis protein CheA [Tenuifilaceae bacterium]HRX68730.1 chemotaxis protein CheA [Tenuifilaceae bacterium]